MADTDSARPLGAGPHVQLRRGDHPFPPGRGGRFTPRSTVDGKKKRHRSAPVENRLSIRLIPFLFFVPILFTGCLPAPSPQPALEVARAAALETKIRAYIAAEPMLDEEAIRVEVGEGKIVLKGKVAREAQKEKAAEVAVRAGGDLPIENEIVVQG